MQLATFIKQFGIVIKPYDGVYITLPFIVVPKRNGVVELEPMQKVNIFVEQHDGKTMYRQGLFDKNKKLKDILWFYGLLTNGADIYVGGEKVNPETKLCNLSLGRVCFISCIYGDIKLPKRSATK